MIFILVGAGNIIAGFFIHHQPIAAIFLIVGSRLIDIYKHVGRLTVVLHCARGLLLNKRVYQLLYLLLRGCGVF